MASKEEGVQSRSMEVSCDEKLVVEKQKMEECEELEGLKQRGPVSTSNEFRAKISRNLLSKALNGPLGDPTRRKSKHGRRRTSTKQAPATTTTDHKFDFGKAQREELESIRSMKLVQAGRANRDMRSRARHMFNHRVDIKSSESSTRKKSSILVTGFQNNDPKEDAAMFRQESQMLIDSFFDIPTKNQRVLKKLNSEQLQAISDIEVSKVLKRKHDEADLGDSEKEGKRERVKQKVADVKTALKKRISRQPEIPDSIVDPESVEKYGHHALPESLFKPGGGRKVKKIHRKTKRPKKNRNVANANDEKLKHKMVSFFGGTLKSHDKRRGNQPAKTVGEINRNTISYDSISLPSLPSDSDDLIPLQPHGLPSPPPPPKLPQPPSEKGPPHPPPATKGPTPPSPPPVVEGAFPRPQSSGGPPPPPILPPVGLPHTGSSDADLDHPTLTSPLQDAALSDEFADDSETSGDETSDGEDDGGYDEVLYDGHTCIPSAPGDAEGDRLQLDGHHHVLPKPDQLSKEEECGGRKQTINGVAADLIELEETSSEAGEPLNRDSQSQSAASCSSDTFGDHARSLESESTQDISVSGTTATTGLTIQWGDVERLQLTAITHQERVTQTERSEHHHTRTTTVSRYVSQEPSGDVFVEEELAGDSTATPSEDPESFVLYDGPPTSSRQQQQESGGSFEQQPRERAGDTPTKPVKTSSLDSTNDEKAQRYKRIFSSPQISFQSEGDAHYHASIHTVHSATPHGYYTRTDNPFRAEFKKSLDSVQSSRTGSVEETDLPSLFLDKEKTQLLKKELGHMPTKAEYITFTLARIGDQKRCQLAMIGDRMDKKYDVQLEDALDSMFEDGDLNLTWDSFSSVTQKLAVQSKIQDSAFLITSFGRRLYEVVPDMGSAIKSYTQKMVERCAGEVILSVGGWDQLMASYGQAEADDVDCEDWSSFDQELLARGTVDATLPMGFHLYSPDPEYSEVSLHGLQEPPREHAMRSVPASIARPTGSDVAPPPAISLLPSFSPQASSHNHPTPQQLPSYHTLPVQLSHQLTSRREKNLALKRFNSVEVLFQESSESDSELDEVYPLYSEHLQHRRRHSFSRAVSTSSLDDTLSPSYGSPPFDVKFRRNRTELTSTSVYGVISGKGVGEAGGNVKVMESMLTDELLTTRHRHGSFSSVGSGSTIHIVTAEHIMEEIRSRPPLDGGGGSEEEPSGEYVTVGLDSPEGGGGGGEGGGEGRGEEGGGGVMNTIFSLAPLSLAVGALIALYLRR